MFSKKQLSIQEVRDKASKATEKLDRAFMAWSIIWDTYTTLEAKKKKTEKDIAFTTITYEEMCLAWEFYQNEVLASNESYKLAFKAACDLCSCMHGK